VSRLTRISLVVLLVLLAGGGLWWLLAPDAPYPPRAAVEGLNAPTTVRWTNAGLASIETRDSLDAFTALGYVHGLTRGWTIALWRQTARGTLSRWFGTGLVPIDRHTRRLELAVQARVTYEQLPAATKRRLKAYTHGVNAAFQSPRVRQQDPFVLLDVQPAPWKPWHTLAIERLLSWLATPTLSRMPGAPAAVTDFRKRDQQLRRWLHLHGWDRSVSWAMRPRTSPDSSRTVLFHRHVMGATAPAIVQEITLKRPSTTGLTGATLPGVPIFVTGTRDGEAWASLLRSRAHIVRAPFDSSQVTQRYERLTPSNGDEQLVQIQRLGRTLLLGTDTTASPPDSTLDRPNQPDSTRSAPSGTAWVLRWPGLSPTSDLQAWLKRAGLTPNRPDTTSFTLFEGDGLRITPTGTWTVTGTPSVVVRDSANQHILVGHSDWIRYQARSLRANHRPNTPIQTGRWSASDSSTWAARLLPTLQPALDRLSQTHPQFQNVATYLQNWDHVYDPSSIGATLFDQWMRAYRSELGHLPTVADTSVYFSTYRQHQALLHALDTLQTRFGPDVRQWRWERAVSNRRYFPVWSADSLVQKNLQDLSTTQYAPLDRRGRGHPSALAGGPSLVDPSPIAPAPTTWEGWTVPAGSTLVVRRHRYDPAALFARSRIQRTRPSPIQLSPDSTSYTTTLVPSSSP
jgi:penicillin amidase